MGGLNEDKAGEGQQPPLPEVSLRPGGRPPQGMPNTTGVIPGAEGDAASEEAGDRNEQAPASDADSTAEALRTVGPSLGQITLRANPEIVELEEAEGHPASGGIVTALSGAWEEPDAVELLLRGLIGTLLFGPGNLQMAAHRTLKGMGARRAIIRCRC